jgi:hypothetical protein
MAAHLSAAGDINDRSTDLKGDFGYPDGSACGQTDGTAGNLYGTALQ